LGAAGDRLVPNGFGQVPGTFLPNRIYLQPYADERPSQHEGKYNNASTNSQLLDANSNGKA
jgi:hypothetical protein